MKVKMKSAIFLLDVTSVRIFRRFLQKKHNMIDDDSILFIFGEDTIREMKKFPDIAKLTYVQIDEKSFMNYKDTVRISDILAKAIKIFFKDDIGYIFENEIFLNYLKSLNGLLRYIHINLREKQFENIFLVGGTNKCWLHPVFFGDGEAPFKLLFRRSWGINNIIYKSIKKIISIKVIWVEENSIKVRFLSTLRILLIYSIRIIALLKYILFSRSIDKLKKTNKKITPIIVRCNSQDRFVRRFIDSFFDNKNQPTLLVECSNLIQDSFLQYENTIKMNSRGLYKIYDIFWVFWILSVEILRKIKCKLIYNRNNILCIKIKEGYDIEFNIYTLWNEIGSMRLESLYRYKKLSSWFTNNLYNLDNKIVTTEMIAYGSCLHKKIATNINKKLWTIQCGMMPKHLIPKINTDYFLSYSKNFVEYASKKFNGCNFIYYEKLKGNYIKKRSAKKHQQVIGVFTQPDDYVILFEKILQILIKIILEEKKIWKILIKPHPRDRNKLYRKLYNDFSFIDISYESVEKVCLMVDIAITSTSTVILDLQQQKVPVISILPEGKQNLDIDSKELIIEMKYNELDILNLEKIIERILTFNFDYQKNSEE
ncbi:hypothetical protein CVT91_08055 [Candidatus Atribacteria bacterium HGW-Atribacteria-1]|nr:MAG: hypothetical protein CVT91_08055 [Candidatus Atribacteria bacterium HGW-Atribacteria-1]